MALREKDVKLLWGRSGARCALCREAGVDTLLTQEGAGESSAYVLGQQAHIIGENPGSARYSESLDPASRNSYHNHILLCPNHHIEIDRDIEGWPAERLYVAKSKHEYWVMTTLSAQQDARLAAANVIAAAVIDRTVRLCRLEGWEAWTSSALEVDPKWDESFPGQLFEYRQYIAAAIWHEEHDELRRASETLSFLVHAAASRFMDHAISLPGTELLGPDKFYRKGGWNPNYHADAEKYGQWLSECRSLIHQAGKAVNWFADVVRREINPSFFAEHGKFRIIEGPFEDLKHYAYVPEYSESEKAELPDTLPEYQS